MRGSNEPRKNVKRSAQNPLDTEEDDYFCLVCVEAYSDSLPGEQWVQCTGCRDWAHGAGASYVCMNCESD